MKLLVEHLKSLGKAVLQTKEPDGGHLGAEVRSILTCPGRQLTPAEQLLLVSAARFDHVRSVIRPALANDIWVISDRFIDSTYAFQVAVSDIDLRQLFQSTSEIVVGATLPNLTIVLDLPLDVAIGRRSLRSDGILDPAEATRDFASIREGLLTVARKETKRCHVVNANQTLEAVAQDIWFIVERLL